MSITQAATDCIEVLEAYANTNGTEVHSRAEDISVLLKIWATRVGVFVSGDNAIDQRLKDDHEVLDILSALLDRLLDLVKQGTSSSISQPLDIETSTGELGRHTTGHPVGVSEFLIASGSNDGTDEDSPRDAFSEAHAVIDDLYNTSRILSKINLPLQYFNSISPKTESVISHVDRHKSSVTEDLGAEASSHGYSNFGASTYPSASPPISSLLEDEWSSLSLEEDLSDYDLEYPDTVKTSARLRKFLSVKVVDGVFDKVPQEFVPEGVVQKCMNYKVVGIALGIKNANEEEEELISFIVDKAPKAFAVTVVAKINANKAMRWLKQNGITDDNLPVPSKTDVWQQSWQAEFYKAQWMFFATVFSTVNYGHNLQEAHIIPFVEKISDVGHGAFGIVSQYAVHKAHMDPVGQTSRGNHATC